MRLGFLILLAGLGLSSPAQAQAPRDVLLEVCNQTGFTVAAAAAYRTTLAESRALRSWSRSQRANASMARSTVLSGTISICT